MSRDLAHGVRVRAACAHLLAHALRAAAPLRRWTLIGGTRCGVEHFGHDHLDAPQDVRSADELVGVERCARRGWACVDVVGNVRE